MLAGRQIFAAIVLSGLHRIIFLLIYLDNVGQITLKKQWLISECSLRLSCVLTGDLTGPGQM